MLLVPTPDVKRDIILIGTAIRKSPDIVAAYLRCLAAQRLIPGVEVAYHFILDTADESVHQLVNEFLASRDGMAEIEQSPAPAYDDNHPTTHQWTSEAMGRVGRMKDRIIQRAIQTGASHLWFCDADLLCDPSTLRSLYYAGQPVACAVYWTRWNNHPSIHAAPQVWLQHPYELRGRGYPDEPTFRARLLTKELTQVWGQGACTLIQRAVLESGVRFAYLPGISTDGMMAGEDRHFSLACEQRHIPMYADPWPHIFHVYHPEDRALIDQHEKAFAVMLHDYLSVSPKQEIVDATATAQDQNREVFALPKSVPSEPSVVRPVPSGVHEGVAQDAQNVAGATIQGQGEELRARVPQAGEVDSATVSGLRGTESPDAPRGLQQTTGRDVALPTVPSNHAPVARQVRVGQAVTPRWVSLRCAMLEPIPTGTDTFGHLHPVHVRCRVDTGAMLPDLERQVLNHLDGQPFIAEVHYPSTYPIQWLRGTRRLMEVTVVDSKSHDHPPVLHDDMAGPIDLSRYTAQQQETLHG